MSVLIKVRRDTAANWTSVNPVLAAGEPGLAVDTRVMKWGNGVNAWVDLPGVSVDVDGGGGGGVTAHDALTGLTNDDHPQYHTNARGDARYYQLSQDLATQVELNGEVTARGNADNLLIPLTQRAAANGVATLDAGSKIPSVQLPPLAVNETFTVASQAAMLALTAQRGDLAIRTDTNQRFVLSTDSPSTLADWIVLADTDAVLTVDGLPGPTVSLAPFYAPITEPISVAHATADPAHTAANIPVIPTGEMVETRVQAALETLFMRTSPDRLFDDIAVAYELREDFTGGGVVAAGGRAGENGWAIPIGAAAAVTSVATTGSTSLATLNFTLTSTAVGVYGNINNHVLAFEGSPVFRWMWRISLSALSSGGNEYAVYIGMHNSETATEPTDGFYFRYSTAFANWQFIVANNGTRTIRDTGIPVAIATQIKLEARCDGSGNVQPYIQGVPAGALVNTNMPGAGRRWGASSIIAKTLGTGGTFILRNDLFACRVELPR